MTLAKRMRKHADGEVGITSPNHPDLVAMYTMDNISGSTLFDESPNSNDGSIIGASVIPGKIGDALSFDGINDHVRMDNFPAFVSDKGSVSIWEDISTTGASTRQFCVSRTTAGNDFFAIALNSAGTVFIFGENAASGYFQLSSVDTLPTSGFQHLVVQSDGVSCSAYINDVQTVLNVDVGANLGQWTDYVDFPNYASVAFLNKISSGYGAFKWDLSRNFNRSLTPSEISELYNGGAGA